MNKRYNISTSETGIVSGISGAAADPLGALAQNSLCNSGMDGACNIYDYARDAQLCQNEGDPQTCSDMRKEAEAAALVFAFVSAAGTGLGALAGDAQAGEAAANSVVVNNDIAHTKYGYVCVAGTKDGCSDLTALQDMQQHAFKDWSPTLQNIATALGMSAADGTLNYDAIANIYNQLAIQAAASQQPVTDAAIKKAVDDYKNQQLAKVINASSDFAFGSADAVTTTQGGVAGGGGTSSAAAQSATPPAPAPAPTTSATASAISPAPANDNSTVPLSSILSSAWGEAGKMLCNDLIISGCLETKSGEFAAGALWSIGKSVYNLGASALTFGSDAWIAGGACDDSGYCDPYYSTPQGQKVSAAALNRISNRIYNGFASASNALYNFNATYYRATGGCSEVGCDPAYLTPQGLQASAEAQQQLWQWVKSPFIKAYNSCISGSATAFGCGEAEGNTLIVIGSIVIPALRAAAPVEGAGAAADATAAARAAEARAAEARVAETDAPPPPPLPPNPFRQQVADLFNPNNPTNGITIGNRSVISENFGSAKIFNGVNDAEVMQYFENLTGEPLPAPAEVLAKGKHGGGIVYTIKTPEGNFNLRNFSSSQEASGANWTIDVPKKILGTGTKGFEELKFRP